MIFIRKLIWDTWNVKHIARHNVIPEEVEALCKNNPLVLQGQSKSRLVLLGYTDEERFLAIVLESQGKGVYYPITAYDASEKDLAFYKRLKGGVK